MLYVQFIAGFVLFFFKSLSSHKSNNNEEISHLSPAHLLCHPNLLFPVKGARTGFASKSDQSGSLIGERRGILIKDLLQSELDFFLVSPHFFNLPAFVFLPRCFFLYSAMFVTLTFCHLVRVKHLNFPFSPLLHLCLYTRFQPDTNPKRNITLF